MVKQRMLSVVMLVTALNTTNITQNYMTQATFVDAANTPKVMYTTTRVNVRTKPTIKSKIIKTIKTNKKIKVIKKLDNGWSKIVFRGKKRYIYSKYLCRTKQKYIDMDVPSKNGFKSYMSYNCITDTSSNQYSFQQNCYTGEYGIRMKDERYCIAVGSYYTTKIGTKIDLIMQNGSTVKCILADCKADIHTDNTNRQNPNGSIVEFIVDMDSLNHTAKYMGDISYCNKQLKGEIEKIRVYE